MGQKIILTDAAFVGCPVIYDDPIIGTGALVLHDLGHSLGAVSGVPLNGAAIPNIAWKQASALMAGVPSQAALSSAAYTNGTLISPSYPVVERTPKLGLHAIRSQVNDVAGSEYSLRAAADVKAYMLANKDHAFYVSIWDRITRVQTSNGAPYAGQFMFGVNTSNFICNLGQGQFAPPVGAKQIGAATSNGYNEATGNRLAQLGVAASTGTISTLSHTVPYMWGGTGGGFSGLHIGASQIFYRCYVEDLTVSAAAGGYAGGAPITVAQRYAEVAAKDLALYTAAFAAGGKFNGDSFTSPAGYP